VPAAVERSGLEADRDAERRRYEFQPAGREDDALESGACSEGAATNASTASAAADQERKQVLDGSQSPRRHGGL